MAWAAQPKQRLLISCPIHDALFGGARGGGKTDGLLGDFLFFANDWGRHARGILFRRSYPEFEEIERRSHEIYPYTGAVWKAGIRTWLWPSGATLKLRFLDKDADAESYIGHSYTWLGFDQMEQWPNAKPIDKLRATLRAGEIAMPKYFRCTANPGGVGHNWIKARYKIGVVRPMTTFYDEKLHTDRVYIPSLLEDNEALTRNDPHYWQKVEASVAGNRQLLLAWRYGLWNVAAGGMFDDVFQEDIHIIDEPWFPDHNWSVDRSLDWGSSAPFSVGWYATAQNSCVGPRRTWVRRGTKVRFLEWYGCQYEVSGMDEDMNVGVKLSSREVARGVKEVDKELKRDHDIEVLAGGTDSAIYAVTDDHSIADEMKDEGIRWKEADKGPGSRKVGWELIRTRLKSCYEVKGDIKVPARVVEFPGLFVTRNCSGWIRTVPSLPRDLEKTEDVDSKAEDHPGDECRYNLMVKKPSIQVGELLM